jgi:hypothetical protein
MNSKELTKDARIKKEFNRLKRIFKMLPKDQLISVQSLMKNAAFMAVTLEDLQMAINENGVISEYKNGENQFGTKKSPEVDVYNTMIKNYSSVVKQLCDFLPDSGEGKNGGKDDALMNFVKQ